MNLTQQIARHFREVHFGGNWTWSNLKDTLADVSWQQATTPVYSLNAHDKFSFDLPGINSQKDWENLLNKTWDDAENFANLIEQLPENKLEEIFCDEKYGTYYRNLHGIIEHTHYHLGQIVIIKKIILQVKTKDV